MLHLHLHLRQLMQMQMQDALKTASKTLVSMDNEVQEFLGLPKMYDMYSIHFF